VTKAEAGRVEREYEGRQQELEEEKRGYLKRMSQTHSFSY
jgi:hypothetical protein